MHRSIKLPRFDTVTGKTAAKREAVRSPKESVVKANMAAQKKQSTPSVTSVFEEIVRRKERQFAAQPQKRNHHKTDPEQQRIIENYPEEESPVQLFKTPPTEQPAISKPLFTDPTTAKSLNHKQHKGFSLGRSPAETEKLKSDETRRKLMEMEKQSQRKSDLINELQRSAEQKEVEFENEIGRLTAEKKRVQESLVKKTIQLQSMRREASHFQQEKYLSRMNALKECELEIEQLKIIVEELQEELSVVKQEHQNAKEEIARLTADCRKYEYESIQATSNELLIMDKIAILNRTVEDYSKELKQLNTVCQKQLQQKDKQLEGLTRELHDLKKMNNLSHNGNFSKSAAEHELRKTIVRFQASQTLSTQLRSTNNDLLKKSKSAELKALDLEKRVQLLGLKQSSFESENKRLKQTLLDKEKVHIAEMQSKHEQTLAMRSTIDQLKQRLETHIQQQNQEPDESTVRERHLLQLVNKYRSELDTLGTRLHTTENQLRRLRSHPVDSAESETVDRERSIKQLIEKDISSLVRQDD